ncbi:hypothetical protein HQ520_12315 [bacterium]|nr:hypothetical protein [bacterium]
MDRPPDGPLPAALDPCRQGRHGDPLDHDPCQATSRRAFRGLCVAIVESTSEPGETVIRASAPRTCRMPTN